MDNEKLFDEKLKKRIKDENVIVPPELNEKINGTLHNLQVKKKSYKIHMMIISARFVYFQWYLCLSFLYKALRKMVEYLNM